MNGPADARRLDDSARRSFAAWVGQPPVAAIIQGARPDFQEVAGLLGLDLDDVLEAAMHVMGGRAIYADGSESGNPFESWSRERLDRAGVVAAGIRRIIKVVAVELLQQGVAIEPVGTDPGAADGLRFAADHVYLAWLLWTDVILEGRSPAQIAADLPGLPPVHWDTEGALRPGGRASQQDVADAFARRRAWLNHQCAPRLRKAYAGGGATDERRRDARRDALRPVLEKWPDVTAGRIRKTWGSTLETPGRTLRIGMKAQPQDDPPSISTLSDDLRELKKG